MSFKETLKKLQASKEFYEFKKKHKSAFLFSAFFVLAQDFTIVTEQLDFFIPPRKVATFYINENKHKTEEFKPQGKITKLNESVKIDINKLQEIIKKEITSQKLEAFDLNKIIAILQKINDKEQQIWNITCFFNSFKMLRMHVDCFDGKVLKSEQASVLDFIQVKK